MMILTLSLFSIFIVFQILYIFVPLYLVKEKREFIKTSEEKRISILIPAFNEEKIIMNCIEGIHHLDYSNYEVIIINDGSVDQTKELLINKLKMKRVIKSSDESLSYNLIKGLYKSAVYPKIYMIDKENGGKADALNAGIDHSESEIVITLDADSVLESNSLNVINTRFDDQHIMAAGGMVQIGQGFYGDLKNLQPTFYTKGLIKYQIIQYLTDFYLHRLTQTKFQSMTIIAGAFGVFRKNILLEVNGYRKTVGEDMDITLRCLSLKKEKYKKHKLVFIPEAICYTECPSSFIDLFKQRIRWQKAFLDCILNYKTAFFKKLGWAPSIYLLFDSFILGTINAFFTIFVCVILVVTQGNYMVALAFLSVTFLLAVYRSVTAMVISRRFGLAYSRKDYFKISCFILYEIITYRLLGLVFVTVGTIMYVKNKEGWDASRRNGKSFQTSPERGQLRRTGS
ncbi:glycosyltransferase family 2 protein [Bacillus sp. H-16]|uniref:glycosyltransferase family 2 protein n=1 Tax=Alteribacter salitolerans TaxID=2912333 RepID=UPI001964B634|nr:glycosyltransferase [Alteribacter salitolerans]MBM7095636.1 glycosyltransferase family 2 protein [Alteribacter salitolerans]